MNVGLARKKAPRATLAALLAKGTPGPLGAEPAAANPKAVSSETQSVRLARLLLKGQ